MTPIPTAYSANVASDTPSALARWRLDRGVEPPWSHTWTYPVASSTHVVAALRALLVCLECIPLAETRYEGSKYNHSTKSVDTVSNTTVTFQIAGGYVTIGSSDDDHFSEGTTDLATAVPCDGIADQISACIKQVVLDHSGKSKAKSTFKLVCSDSSRGLYLKEFDLDQASHYSIDALYNDDTVAFHGEIVERLNQDRPGIVLLHGLPGTGKTSYLRQLIGTLTRPTIYLPPNLASEVSSPQFLTFLLEDAKGSAVIIEDAENVLMTREAGGNQAVSNLLNISDGILGDALKIQLICTFNTQVEHVDSALRRPGRLLGEHSFGKLNAIKTRSLIERLHGDDAANTVVGGMDLASIFGMKQMPKSIAAKAKPYGFA